MRFASKGSQREIEGGFEMSEEFNLYIDNEKYLDRTMDDAK